MRESTKLNRSLLVDLQKRSVNFDLQKYDDYVKDQDKQKRPQSGNRYGNNNNKMDQLSTATSFFQNNQSFLIAANNIQEKEPINEQDELDIEAMMIETNHNEINTFNYDKPMLESIDPESLEKYTEKKQEEFSEIHKITIKFDANADSLQLVGDLMPNLNELKLNNSIIPSIRDIGTSLQNLKIIWINRVGLEDLSGINSLMNLQELYANYNSINDLMPLDFNDKIEILDLEGNDIEDLTNIQFLETMGSLNDLNLSNNPISLQKGYRFSIIQKLKNLQVFDEDIVDMKKEEIRNLQEQELQDQIQQLQEEEQQKFVQIYDQVQIKNDKVLDEETLEKIQKQKLNEPNEEMVLLQSVKKVSKKISDKKDIFMTLQDKKKEQIQQEGGSQLTQGQDTAFSGNPFKALKANKKKTNTNIIKLADMPEEFDKMMENYKQTDVYSIKDLKREFNMNPEYGMNTPQIQLSKKRPQSAGGPIQNIDNIDLDDSQEDIQNIRQQSNSGNSSQQNNQYETIFSNKQQQQEVIIDKKNNNDIKNRFNQSKLNLSKAQSLQKDHSNLFSKQTMQIEEQDLGILNNKSQILKEVKKTQPFQKKLNHNNMENMNLKDMKFSRTLNGMSVTKPQSAQQQKRGAQDPLLSKTGIGFKKFANIEGREPQFQLKKSGSSIQPQDQQQKVYKAPPDFGGELQNKQQFKPLKFQRNVLGPRVSSSSINSSQKDGANKIPVKFKMPPGSGTLNSSRDSTQQQQDINNNGMKPLLPQKKIGATIRAKRPIGGLIKNQGVHQDINNNN